MVGITTLKNVRNIKAQANSEKPFKKQDPMAPDQLEARAGLGKILKDKFMSSMLTLAAAIASGANSFGRKGLIFASLALSACIAFGACGEEKEKEDDPAGDADTDTDTGPHSSTDTDTDVDTDCDDTIENKWEWALEISGDRSVTPDHLVSCADGSSIILGRVDDGNHALFGGDYDLGPVDADHEFLVKYDSNGDFVWITVFEVGVSGYTAQVAANSDCSYLVAAGDFFDTLNIGSEVLSEDGSAGFVATFDSGGQVIWAKSQEEADIMGVAIHSDYSVMVSGDFDELAVTFGEAPNQTQLFSINDGESFLAKYEADGSFAWVAQTWSDEEAWDAVVATLMDGSSVVSGRCEGGLSLGEEGNAVHFDQTEKGGFLVKYGTDGLFVWGRRLIGNEAEGDNSHSIIANPDGSFLVVGVFDEAVTLSAGEPDELTLSANTKGDTYIAKYASDGSLLWATVAGGDYDPRVAVAADNSFYLAGGFAGDEIFGLGEANETTVSYDPQVIEYPMAGYLAKYDSQGTLQWVEASKSNRHALHQGVDVAGNFVYVTGFFDGTMHFGEGCDVLELEGLIGDGESVHTYIAKREK